HGLGEPVENARMQVTFPSQGIYHVWVRTKNWVPGNWEAPGRFKVKIGETTLEQEFGTKPGWSWEYGGEFNVSDTKTIVELVDLTGFDGRCDAIYFSTDNVSPPDRGEELATWRQAVLNQTNAPEETKTYDYVVVGGGIAGCANAIAAAEQGLKVALIHDRPV